MFYETTPDVSDGHTHTVDLDENGDGITEEQGEYPHVHEVYSGVVKDAQRGNYRSSHPGPLVSIEEPSEDQEMTSPDKNTSDEQMAMGSANESTYLIKNAINLICEGVDVVTVVDRLLG